MNKGKILVVDDDPDTTYILARLLEIEGYSVFEAHDGYQALEILDTQPALNLVITDVKMPNMDGRELLKRMRQDHRLTKIPVIVVCASAIFVEELGNQAESVMLKPLDMPKLLTLVEGFARANVV